MKSQRGHSCRVTKVFCVMIAFGSKSLSIISYPVFGVRIRRPLGLARDMYDESCNVLERSVRIAALLGL